MQLHFDFYEAKIAHLRHPRKQVTGFLPRLLKRDGAICYLCGEEMLIGIDQLHVDHVLPVHHGGTDTEDNLRPVHAACNRYRGALLFTDPDFATQIAKAKKQILLLRTSPHKHLCIDCSANLSSFAVQRLRCDECIKEHYRQRQADERSNPTVRKKRNEQWRKRYAQHREQEKECLKRNPKLCEWCQTPLCVHRRKSARFCNAYCRNKNRIKRRRKEYGYAPKPKKAQKRES